MFKHVIKEELKIVAQMQNLAKFRDFIGQVGHKYRFEEKFINSYKLVVDEICTNIIRHGYQDVKNGEILLSVIVRRLSMTVIVIDRGKTYDPRTTKDPDLLQYINIGKKGGLGTFMVRKLVDDIQYSVTSRGNELRLTKYREAPEQNKIAEKWHNLNLRGRASAIVAAAMIFISISSYFYLGSEIADSVMQNTAETVFSLNANLSQAIVDKTNEGDDLGRWSQAKLVKESNADIIHAVLVFDTSWNAIVQYPVIGNEQDRLHPILLSLGQIDEKFHFPLHINDDSTLIVFVSPIIDNTFTRSKIGYSILLTPETYLTIAVRQEKQVLLIRVVLGTLIAYGAVIFLIFLIVTPFQKLADWVRKVGRGVVDEDEIDIDSRDELGEIAQAFNEMTSKFRESQQALIDRQRMSRELQVAQEIQQMLLPDDFPEVFGYDLTSYYQAAKEVGGDLFDFVEVDDHTIGICVADVSGKGVPGSMVMTMIRTALRLEARGNKNPADVLTRVNQFVTGDIKKGMFVTAFYIVLDSRKRVISYASAGHNPMILYRGKTKETFYLNPTGFPIGITLPDPELFGNTIKVDSIRLHPDDLLLAYTDGVTEAMNPQRELYSDERLLDIVRNEGHNSVTEFVKKLQDHLLAFTAGFEQNDDITLVSIKESMEVEDVKLKMLEDIFEKVDLKETTVTQACMEAGISAPTYYKYKKIYLSGAKETLEKSIMRGTNGKENKKERNIAKSAAQAKLKQVMHLIEKTQKSKIKVNMACKQIDLPVSTFYRYKKTYLEGGFNHLRELIHGYTNLGVQHMSIEAKTKMYDIIANHPTYGSKRIASELMTEKYHFLQLKPKLIYDELKRAKLSNKDQRMNFISRGGKRRLKPPGTPLLTLDGEVMVGFRLDDGSGDDGTLFSSKPAVSSGQAKEKIITSNST